MADQLWLMTRIREEDSTGNQFGRRRCYIGQLVAQSGDCWSNVKQRAYLELGRPHDKPISSYISDPKA